MIKDIKGNDYESFILLENGDLWGCGSNFCGELGLGHNKLINTFVKVCNDVKKIKHYPDAIFLFKKDQTLWFAGDSSYLGREEDITSFIKVDNNVKDVSFMELPMGNFLFCLKNNGDLLDLIESKIYLSNVEKVIGGYKGEKFCLFIINKDGSLSFLEDNFLNKIESFNEVKNVFSDLKVPIFIQKIDDSLWKIEENSFKKGVKIFDDIKKVKTFNDKSFFLKKDGDLFVLGENYYGELGIDLKKTDVLTLVNSNVKEVCSVSSYTLVLKNDNSLWGCGKNIYNILGNESEDYNFYSFKKICDDIKKFYVDGASLFVIKQNDELWCSGKVAKYFQGNNYLKFVSDNIEDVFSNSVSFFILKKNNVLLCFGNNMWGQLGIGSEKEWINKPIECTVIKNYYNTKETVKVIKDVFKERSL